MREIVLAMMALGIASIIGITIGILTAKIKQDKS